MVPGPNWCSVGPHGRHRHCPIPQGTSVPVTVSGTQPLQADTAHMHHLDMSMQLSPESPKSDRLASLTLLPGIALACIFHHLDYTSAHRLAATCQACAAEFQQQKADLTERHWAELLPTVICDLPDQTGRYRYGYDFPVVLHVEWQPAQAATLRRMYAMRQNAGLLKALWRRTLPQSLWTDLLHDGLPEAQPQGWYDSDHLRFDVRILIASDDFLCLPWSWLGVAFQYGPAAALTHVLNASGPQQLRMYDTSLHRPAQGGKTQVIMKRCFTHERFQETPSEPHDNDDTCSVQSFYPDYPSGDIYVRSQHRQLVAITGRWCHELPDANEDLWRAHHGCHLRGLTAGDDIAYRIDRLPDDVADEIEKLADGFDPQIGKLSTSSLGPGSLAFLPERVAEVFKPYTCEIETLDWYSKRQSAKSKGHAKVKRSRQAARPACTKRHM